MRLAGMMLPGKLAPDTGSRTGINVRAVALGAKLCEKSPLRSRAVGMVVFDEEAGVVVLGLSS